jgi:hypothetical protein
MYGYTCVCVCVCGGGGDLPMFYDNFMCTFLLSRASNVPRVFCSYRYCETTDNTSKENKHPSPMCSNMEFNVQIKSLHYGKVDL